jgi:peptide subunit release factor 1 (eRF1)
MTKCIVCGDQILQEFTDSNYKCSNCNLEWSQAEHIDDITYLIHENKKLEQRVQTLEQQLNELLELMKM